MDPELIKALLPYGGGGFAVVMVYLFYREAMKTWRTKMVTKDEEDTEV